MGLQLGWWTLDALDAPRLARFYEGLLGWQRLFDDDTGVALVPTLPPVLGQGLLLYAEHGTGPKEHKNRAHLDLRGVDQRAMVAQALELGASRADIGQGEVSWEVLTDPEGNEFCILAGPADGPEVEAWALDANDVDLLARFWAELLGWEEVEREEGFVHLRDPAGDADALQIIWSPDPKRSKNRLHPDLFPDRPGEEARAEETARALDLGATRADIGQGEVSWTVLADPEGNEFCILLPGPPPDVPA
jgi:catechol 2,3-dioxygenase-like lactoylglutathione lyase family enzyme